jgi:hypothetical protein
VSLAVKQVSELKKIKKKKEKKTPQMLVMLVTLVQNVKCMLTYDDMCHNILCGIIDDFC